MNNNEKTYYQVVVREVKEHIFAVPALNSENAAMLVEEAYANGNFDMSDIEGEVTVQANGASLSPVERQGKLSLDYNFQIDIFK